MTLTAHKKSSFQAKIIVLLPPYSQKHKYFFKRQTFFEALGTLITDFIHVIDCPRFLNGKNLKPGSKPLRQADCPREASKSRNCEYSVIVP